MRPIISTLFVLVSLTGFAQLTILGSANSVITVSPETSTGLDKLYVVDNTSGLSASYPSAGAVWYRFSNLGGAYAEEVKSRTDGNTSVINLSDKDMGYIVEDGGRRHYYWIVNYADHELSLNGITVSTESQCDRTLFDVSGKGDRITYYSINGAPHELSRELILSYRTLSFDTEAFVWHETQAEESFGSLSATINCPAPLCNTEFTLSGDRFLRAWGRELSATTPSYSTSAVEARTQAEQKTEEYDNQQTSTGNGLGGSAPCEITFTAAPTDAVVFREWQFSRTPEFEDVYERYNEDQITHTFDENGTIYIRYFCANDAGNCEFAGETYTVDIGESRLECPNAFSPANQDGVNDEWKVSYQSIVSFDCHIFNRWGKELARLTHPSQGWNGKVGGKFVPSGVYFYVIEAKGADGRKYKLSGDINIIGTRLNSTGNSETE